MRALPTTADPFGIATAADYEAAGWSRSAVRHAVATGRIEQIARGVWAPALDPRDPAADAIRVARRAVASALTARGTLVSHLGAATVLGLPSWAPRPRSCVAAVGRSRLELAGVHTHRVQAPAHALRRGRVPVTPPARTAADIAREFGVQAGLVTADAALYQGRATLSDLRAAAGLKGPGGADIATMLALVDPRAESALESRSRWHLVAHDLAPSGTQIWIATREGRILARCDFFWDEGVIGEVDGNVKYATGADPLRAEKWRQELLERTGLLVVRWGARDLRDFGAIARLIRDRRARAAGPGWPRHWLAHEDRDELLRLAWAARSADRPSRLIV